MSEVRWLCLTKTIGTQSDYHLHWIPSNLVPSHFVFLSALFERETLLREQLLRILDNRSESNPGLPAPVVELIVHYVGVPEAFHRSLRVTSDPVIKGLLHAPTWTQCPLLLREDPPGDRHHAWPSASSLGELMSASARENETIGSRLQMGVLLQNAQVYACGLLNLPPQFV